jgi:hypothetical protein
MNDEYRVWVWNGPEFQGDYEGHPYSYWHGRHEGGGDRNHRPGRGESSQGEHPVNKDKVEQSKFRGLPSAFRRLGNAAASLLGIGLFVRAVRFFTSGLLSGLRNMGSSFSEMLSVFLLFVYNFLIVRNVSRVGHGSLYPTSGK